MNTRTTHNYQPLERKELPSVVTRKGQVTIPSSIRSKIGLKEGDRVAFVLGENQKLELVKKEGSVVVQTAGMIQALRPSSSAEQLREEVERSVAEEVIKRSYS
jgi:AbrB family looped-hinge helix DNA binding protein